MAAAKIQHKNCLQRILRKEIVNMLFAGLGGSVLGKAVSSLLNKALGLRRQAVRTTSGTVFASTDLPAGQ